MNNYFSRRRPARALPQGFQRAEADGREGGKEAAKHPHDERQDRARGDDVGIDAEFEHDELPAARPAADEAVGGPAVAKRADGAAQSAADQGDGQRFQQEGDEDLAAVVAQEAEHADVLGPLTDGGEHRVHHAEHAADGHDDGHHGDAVEELPVAFAEVGEVVGLDLGLNGGRLVVIGVEVFELSSPWRRLRRGRSTVV